MQHTLIIYMYNIIGADVYTVFLIIETRVYKLALVFQRSWHVYQINCNANETQKKEPQTV